MEESLFKQSIVLYLINYSDYLRNAYNLIKILSWKFNIIDFNQINKTLVEKNYMIEKVTNQIGHYSITTSGEIFLKEHLAQLLQELKEKYLPNDPEYIQLIMSSADSR